MLRRRVINHAVMLENSTINMTENTVINTEKPAALKKPVAANPLV